MCEDKGPCTVDTCIPPAQLKCTEPEFDNNTINERVWTLCGAVNRCANTDKLHELIKSRKPFVVYASCDIRQAMKSMDIRQILVLVQTANEIAVLGGRTVIFAKDWTDMNNCTSPVRMAYNKMVWFVLKNCCIALGINESAVTFVLESEWINSHCNYWPTVLDIAIRTKTSLHDVDQDNIRLDSMCYSVSMDMANMLTYVPGNVDVCFLLSNPTKTVNCGSATDFFYSDAVEIMLNNYVNKVHELFQNDVVHDNIKLPIIITNSTYTSFPKHVEDDKTTAEVSTSCAASVPPTGLPGANEVSGPVSVDSNSMCVPRGFPFSDIMNSVSEDIISILDSSAEVHRKIESASYTRAAAGELTLHNCVLYILLPWYRTITLDGTTYSSWQDALIHAFDEKLKKSAVKTEIATLLDCIIDKIRKHFASTEELKVLWETTAAGI